MIPDLAGALIAFLFGACIGSFLNVCITRWPEDLSVVKPPSRCPRCGRGIQWYENIPIVSWLLLRGRCRGCGERISALYPIIEVTVALGWALSYLSFGPTLTALNVAVFGTLLLGIAVTDARHYLIPDGFTVFGLFWVLTVAIVATVMGETGPFAGAYDALIGACAGAGAIAIAGWLGELALKKEAMGFGDVTLMAVVGGALGPGRALLTIFVGALLGAVGFVAIVYPIGWMRSRRAGVAFDPPLVPFGVFLAPAALLTLLWGYPVIAWYLGQVGGAAAGGAP
jgi:leader peptidase (prepilin peptidase) / N-methyltransferase